MCTRSVYDLLRHLLHHFPCKTKTLPSFSISFMMMSKNLGIIIGMKFPACWVLHRVRREPNVGSILPIVHSSLDECTDPQISAKMIAEWAAGVWSQAAGQRRGGREGRPRSVRHFSLPLSLSSLTSPPLSISILHMWNSLTLFLPFHQFPSSPKLSPTAHIVSTPARAATPAIPRRIRALTRPAGPRDTPSHPPRSAPEAATAARNGPSPPPSSPPPSPAATAIGPSSDSVSGALALLAAVSAEVFAARRPSRGIPTWHRPRLSGEAERVSESGGGGEGGEAGGTSAFASDAVRLIGSPVSRAGVNLIISFCPPVL